MLRSNALQIDRNKTINAGKNLIFGSGEMANRIRAFAWRLTPLGPIEQWEELLLTTVNTMLASKHAMFLFWGNELIQFYNDAYRATLDDLQHPLALGQRGPECWANIWHIIGPQIDAVMRKGEGLLLEDQFFAGRRTHGHNDTYWTYSYTPVRNIEGVIRGTFVVCNDTTEAVLARNLVGEQRRRLADLFEQAPAFFAVLRGPDHVFEMTNGSYQELIGHRDVIGKTIREGLPETLSQGFVDLLDQVYASGKPYVGRATPVSLYRTSSSSTDLRYLDFIYQPLQEVDNSISGILVFGVDVTERRHAEQLLLQSEKLTAVSQMASAIAHEVNNPLESVTNLIYLARNNSNLGQIQGYLATAEDEIRRVAAITSQTLRFHRQLSRPSLVQTKALVDGSLAVYQRRIANADIKVEAGPWVETPVSCYEGEIRQVINNLVGNAIDAMPKGGRMMVRSRASTNQRDGARGVRLTISDTGSGIAPENLRYIFDPFFTTKGLRGTGLGLWVSKDIIVRHNGRIRVRSSSKGPKHGTVFTIFLPYEAAKR